MDDDTAVRAGEGDPISSCRDVSTATPPTSGVVRSRIPALSVGINLVLNMTGSVSPSRVRRNGTTQFKPGQDGPVLGPGGTPQWIGGRATPEHGKGAGAIAQAEISPATGD